VRAKVVAGAQLGVLDLLQLLVELSLHLSQLDLDELHLLELAVVVDRVDACDGVAQLGEAIMAIDL